MLAGRPAAAASSGGGKQCKKGRLLFFFALLPPSSGPSTAAAGRRPAGGGSGLLFFFALLPPPSWSRAPRHAPSLFACCLFAPLPDDDDKPTPVSKHKKSTYYHSAKAMRALDASLKFCSSSPECLPAATPLQIVGGGNVPVSGEVRRGRGGVAGRGELAIWGTRTEFCYPLLQLF